MEIINTRRLCEVGKPILFSYGKYYCEYVYINFNKISTAMDDNYLTEHMTFRYGNT